MDTVKNRVRKISQEEKIAYASGAVQLLLCFIAIAVGMGKWTSQKQKRRAKQEAYADKLARKEQKAAYQQKMKQNKLQWKKELREEKRMLQKGEI